MEFRKYQHLERFGTDDVEDINIGECLIFHKIDGTNGQVWLDDNLDIAAGSRNRTLTLENDNAGFFAHVSGNENIINYLKKHPNHRLYGEWLVPHTLKTYQEDAWRKFYVFDVCIDKDEEEVEYIPYDTYKGLLEEFSIDYVPPICKIKNGTYENFIKTLEQSTFLVKDGFGSGEGIVIKNYDYYNKYKRQNWAKIVSTEFKAQHVKAMGYNEISNVMIEEKIVDKYVTQAFVDKEYAKIVNENGGWQTKNIPMLLGRVFSELVKEETWNILKEFKNPKIDFKTLNALTVAKIKESKKEIFG